MVVMMMMIVMTVVIVMAIVVMLWTMARVMDAAGDHDCDVGDYGDGGGYGGYDDVGCVHDD